jgi:hypothetical protein
VLRDVIAEAQRIHKVRADDCCIESVGLKRDYCANGTKSHDFPGVRCVPEVPQSACRGHLTPHPPFRSIPPSV